MRRWIIVCSRHVALVCLVSSGCAPPPPEPNVVLIVIDTLRADHIPCYGYEIPTAPFMCALAEDGVLFENAYSTSSWTAPAVASIFTSLYPTQHGVVIGRLVATKLQKADPTMKINRIPDAIDTLPEILKRAGYQTYAVADNYNVSEELGFAQGFDAFDTAWYRGGEAMNEVLTSWHERITQGGKYFLYVHYIDPHSPYHGKKPWHRKAESKRRDTVSRYDSEIRFVDERLEEMYDLFGWERDTLLIVTSDHGEEFWDHGEKGHHHTLYEELLRVPLIVRLPGAVAPRGTRASGLVGLVDLLPTVREFIGLPADARDMGYSLMRALEESQETPGAKRRLYSHLTKKVPDARTRRPEMRAMISQDWKLITSSGKRTMLFNHEQDRGDRNDIARTRPDVVGALESAMADFVSQLDEYVHTPVEIDLSPEERERLESLGYVQ